MKELKKDLFECINDPDVDAICITTNGNYLKNGHAAMGGGCARGAADRWPDMSKRLGKLLKTLKQNVPYVIGAVDAEQKSLELTVDLLKNKTYKCLVCSFPTINNLMLGSDLNLIKQSAKLMVDLANQYNLNGIVIGRPGSGIGGLAWADVKEVIKDILDDRFIIVSFDHEK